MELGSELGPELGPELGQVGFEGLLRLRFVICRRLTFAFREPFVIYIWQEPHKLMGQQIMLHCFSMYHEIMSNMVYLFSVFHGNEQIWLSHQFYFQ